MRINKYIAQKTGLSRRAVDTAIDEDRVTVNGRVASTGQDVSEIDTITLDDVPISYNQTLLTYILHKPVGYICSRKGQGSLTIYSLLPERLHGLKPAGRLDKDSSGLLLLTNDGDLLHRLTHPSFQKQKVYEVNLDKALSPLHQQMISEHGIVLDDGVSKLRLEPLDNSRHSWKVIMHEGRNRQIRRTFDALGYSVLRLHRTAFGPYSIDGIAPGELTPVQSDKIVS